MTCTVYRVISFRLCDGNNISVGVLMDVGILTGKISKSQLFTMTLVNICINLKIDSNICRHEFILTLIVA